MDKSLDDYIATNPVLESAIVGARMRSNHEKRIHNSNEFWAGSYIYKCEDMETDNENNMACGRGTGLFDLNKGNEKYGELSTDKPKPITNFDDAYLALDLNCEEEYDHWFEELNKSTKQAAASVTVKQSQADSSVVERENNVNANNDNFNNYNNYNNDNYNNKNNYNNNNYNNNYNNNNYINDNYNFNKNKNNNYNNNNNKNKNNFNTNNNCNGNKKRVFEEIPYQQPDSFDLRQKVIGKRLDEPCNDPLSQSRPNPSNLDTNRSMKVPPFTSKNNKNNFKMRQTRWGAERFVGNNPIYQAKNFRFANGNTRPSCNNSMLGENQNAITNFGAQSCGCGCSVQAPPSYTHNSTFHTNRNLLGCNTNNLRLEELLFGLNGCGLNSGGGFNTSLNCALPSFTRAECNRSCCSFKNNFNDLNNDSNIAKQLLNMSSCGNDLNKLFNMNVNGAGTERFDHTKNKRFNIPSTVTTNSMHQNTADPPDVNIGDCPNFAPNYDVAPKDYDLETMLSMIKQIVENGITINLFPGKNSANNDDSQTKQ